MLHIVSICFGFLIPLLPALGSDSLLLAGWIFALLCASRVSIRGLRWIAPYIALLFIHLIIEVYYALDVRSQLFSLQDPLGWLQWLSVSPPHYMSSLAEVLRLLLIPVLLQVFVDDGIRLAVWRGLIFGLFISFIVTLLSWLGTLDLPNQSEFWTAIRRLPGTFTDPNAFGVFSALILPLLWAQSGYLKKGFATAWFFLSLLSGSRTLVVGVVLYLGNAVFRFRRWLFIGLVAFVSLGILGVTLYSRTSPERLESVREILPESAGRILESCRLDKISETVYSRAVFARVAYAMWLKAPMFGIGVNRFEEEFPATLRELNLDLGGWRDNANNFFLNVLTESGAFGFLLLILSALSLRFGPNSPNLVPRAAKVSTIIFVILLAFGPHLDFTEIAVLFSFVLASAGARPATSPCPLSFIGSVIMLGVAALVVLFSADSKPNGLYPPEKGGDQMVQWTAGKARMSLACISSENIAKVGIRSLEPGISNNPLKVKIVYEKGATKDIELSDTNIHEVQLPCGVHDKEILAEILPSRVWVPKRSGVGVDPRVVGVQVIQ